MDANVQSREEAESPKESGVSRLRLGVFLGVLGGLVVLLTYLGGWALPVVLLGIVSVVAGHEFGHFIVAKRAGMKVTDYFVGFGPVVWSATIGETRYGLRAFLIGGYVKVIGMTWEDKVDEADEARTYRSKPTWKKVLFASGGPLMNGVMAIVLAWVVLAGVGWPTANNVAIAQAATWNGAKSPAAAAGLAAGDHVVSVDGKTVRSVQQIGNIIESRDGKAVTLVVSDNGVTKSFSVKPVDARSITVKGVALATGKKPDWIIGVDLYNPSSRENVLVGLGRAVNEIGGTTVASVAGIAHVFSPHEFISLFRQIFMPGHVSGATKASRPESVIGVVRLAVQSSSDGAGVLLVILASVNVFVGLFNLLPILPLDGGYVSLAVYERIRSRRGKVHHSDIRKLTPVIAAFVSILIVLFASTLYLDIVSPLANPFH